MSQRKKLVAPVIGRAPSLLEEIPDWKWERAQKLASLLRPTLGKPLRREQAERLARAAKMSVANLRRYRQRLARSELTTSLIAGNAGFRKHGNRLTDEQNAVILQVIEGLQRTGRRLRMVDVLAEVDLRCRALKIAAPNRRSVDRRVERFAPFLVERRKGNVERPAKDKPGHFEVRRPLDVVQIDHTRSDVMVVDHLYRQPIGRPVLSMAIDVASRCVLGLLVTFEAPSATTVAYLLTRIVAAKTQWLASLDLSIDWPMAGLPRSLHLDNAPEFHSKALTRGCSEFGVELIYRPHGRPHFGGHIERLIGTMMSRLKGLPGATGASVADRKKRNPEKTAVLTLKELETWLAVEIGERYHHAEHAGLPGATPYGAWRAQAPLAQPVKNLQDFRIAFLPAIERRVHGGSIQFNRIQYWHSALATLADQRAPIVAHYDPANISRLYVLTPDKTVMEVPFAQMNRPAVALWEVLAANKHLRATSKAMVSEDGLFKAILAQRKLVAQASAKTKKARLALARASDRGRTRAPLISADEQPPATSEVDYSQPADGYSAEVW